MKRVYVRVTKDISFWHPTEGACVKFDGTRDSTVTGHDLGSLFSKELGEGVDVQSVLMNFLNGFFGGVVPLQDVSIAEDGRLWLNRIEDGLGRGIGDSEEYAKANPTLQQYLVDYDLWVEVAEVRTPSKDELSTLFPNLRVGA